MAREDAEQGETVLDSGEFFFGTISFDSLLCPSSFNYSIHFCAAFVSTFLFPFSDCPLPSLDYFIAPLTSILNSRPRLSSRISGYRRCCEQPRSGCVENKPRVTNARRVSCANPLSALRVSDVFDRYLKPHSSFDYLRRSKIHGFQRKSF